MKSSIAAFAVCFACGWTPSAFSHDGYDKAIQAYSCVDYSKAIAMFRTYAEQGHGLSQYMVGIMTEQGQGTLSDPVEAFKWYMKSAQQGTTDAYYALGDMYTRGVGVGKDVVQAYAWLDLASREGHKLAKDALLSLSDVLQAEQIAQAKVIADAWVGRQNK